jgi:hypothetical protein
VNAEAADEVSARVTYGSDPQDAWGVVLALVAAADEMTSGFVGAGPVEDFVRRFGAVSIDKIEQASRRDPKFRECLGAIWLRDGDLPPDIMARVVAASGGRIRPSPGSKHDA